MIFRFIMMGKIDKPTDNIGCIEIKNFKSIKSLKIDNPARINLIIGPPNSGKSNLLEALGLFSVPYSAEGSLKKFVRVERVSDLFFRKNINDPILVRVGNYSLKLYTVSDEGAKPVRFKLEIKFKNETFAEFLYSNDNPSLPIKANYNKNIRIPILKYGFTETRYTSADTELDFPRPPEGRNLINLLLSNKELGEHIGQILAEYGIGMFIDPDEDKIMLWSFDGNGSRRDDYGIGFSNPKFLIPYDLLSDTLKRRIFFGSIVISNRNKIIVLEEPETESHALAVHELADLIRLDENFNTYFITTHNPYFFETIVMKVPDGDLLVLKTRYVNGETVIVKADNKTIKEEITIADPFLQDIIDDV